MAGEADAALEPSFKQVDNKPDHRHAMNLIIHSAADDVMENIFRNAIEYVCRKLGSTENKIMITTRQTKLINTIKQHSCRPQHCTQPTTEDTTKLKAPRN